MLNAAPQRVLTGVVLDVACHPLPGVSIASRGRDAVVTGADGRFAIAVDESTLVLQAQLAGFRTVERVYRIDGSPRERRLFMLIGPLAEVTSVRSAADQRVIDPPSPAEPPRLRGRVLDSQCRPIAAATVRLPGREDVRRTDDDGRFAFATITSGFHDVEVVADGFAPAVVLRVAIDAKNSGAITIAMADGTSDERVTFRAR